jgi:hypothetical protein
MLLEFRSLVTCGANTAVVVNGVSSTERQVCALVSQVEICGYSAKDILQGVWHETISENVHLLVVLSCSVTLVACVKPP